MTLDIKDFYYGNAMDCYEYMKLALDCIPNKIFDQYDLRSLSSDGWVTSRSAKACPASNKPAASPTTGSKLNFPILDFPLVPELLRSGITPPIPSLSPSLLTTLVSSMLAKRGRK